MSAHWTEKQPILPAGTHPLPFVQVGMQLRLAADPYSAGVLVQDVYEDELGMTCARLEGVVSKHRLVTSCDEVRRCYTLMTDFDPNLPDDAA